MPLAVALYTKYKNKSKCWGSTAGHLVLRGIISVLVGRWRSTTGSVPASLGRGWSKAFRAGEFQPYWHLHRSSHCSTRCGCPSCAAFFAAFPHSIAALNNTSNSSIYTYAMLFNLEMQIPKAFWAFSFTVCLWGKKNSIEREQKVAFSPPVLGNYSSLLDKCYWRCRWQVAGNGISPQPKKSQYHIHQNGLAVPFKYIYWSLTKPHRFVNCLRHYSFPDQISVPHETSSMSVTVSSKEIIHKTPTSP